MSIDSVQNAVITALSAVDLTVDVSSPYIELREVVGFAVQFYWSGGVGTTGNFFVEATNDNAASDPPSPNYSIISTTAVGAGSGSVMLNFERGMYSYVRVRWDSSAGAGGTMTSKVSLKRN